MKESPIIVRVVLNDCHVKSSSVSSTMPFVTLKLKMLKSRFIIV